MLFSHSRCVSTMLSVNCNRTSRGSPLFSWNLWTISCQCSHAESSHDVNNLLLLPANYSATQETFVPLMSLLSLSWNNKHYHFHTGPKSQLWVFRRPNAEERKLGKWIVRKRSDKRNEVFSKWDWQQKGKQLKTGKNFKLEVSVDDGVVAKSWRLVDAGKQEGACGTWPFACSTRATSGSCGSPEWFESLLLAHVLCNMLEDLKVAQPTYGCGRWCFHEVPGWHFTAFSQKAPSLCSSKSLRDPAWPQGRIWALLWNPAAGRSESAEGSHWAEGTYVSRTSRFFERWTTAPLSSTPERRTEGPKVYLTSPGKGWCLLYG